MQLQITPEWFIFTRLFVRRYNNFMYHVDQGFSDILYCVGIRYFEHKSNLYFSTEERVVDRVMTYDYDFIASNKERILTCIQDFATGINVKYMNRLDDEEIRLLSVALNYRVESLLVSSSNSCI